MIPLCILAIEDDSDREFMEFLFLQYKRLMYSEIMKIVPDAVAAEDILQSTLVKLINCLQKVRTFERSQRVNYIIAAVQNTAKNYLRDQNRHATVSFDDYLDMPDMEQDRHIAEERLIREEDQQQFTHIWTKLDERSRYLLKSRYILEKSMTEIAQELDIKPESVRMALTRARKAAYRLLQKEMKDNP